MRKQSFFTSLGLILKFSFIALSLNAVSVTAEAQNICFVKRGIDGGFLAVRDKPSVAGSQVMLRLPEWAQVSCRRNGQWAELRVLDERGQRRTFYFRDAAAYFEPADISLHPVVNRREGATSVLTRDLGQGKESCGASSPCLWPHRYSAMNVLESAVAVWKPTSGGEGQYELFYRTQVAYDVNVSGEGVKKTGSGWMRADDVKFVDQTTYRDIMSSRPAVIVNREEEVIVANPFPETIQDLRRESEVVTTRERQIPLQGDEPKLDPVTQDDDCEDNLESILNIGRRVIATRDAAIEEELQAAMRSVGAVVGECLLTEPDRKTPATPVGVQPYDCHVMEYWREKLGASSSEPRTCERASGVRSPSSVPQRITPPVVGGVD